MPEERILTGTELPNIELDPTKRSLSEQFMITQGSIPDIKPEPVSDPKIFEREIKQR